MLRTTIQTTDAATGKELPVPADLLAKVRRAAAVLEDALGNLGKKFDIEARWRFEKDDSGGYGVWLSLTTSNGGIMSHPVPSAALASDATIRRHLWSPLWHFGNVLSGELDLEFERIRQGLQELVNAPGE